MGLGGGPDAIATPTRLCLGCRRPLPKSELLRLVAGDGEIAVDPAARRPGRGAYLCRRPECLGEAVRRRAFARALRAPVNIPEKTLDWIGQWQRSAYTR
ncbi:MAG: YlxR family protein [Thermoleophilaceae bacterium]|nr:YlxR family protein [Thermoleophilaceae bacterium]